MVGELREDCVWKRGKGGGESSHARFVPFSLFVIGFELPFVIG